MLHAELQTEAPIWIRCPQDGQLEPHTGLSAAVLGYLVRPGPWNNYDPPVKTRRVKVRGSDPYRHGSLLISLQSLLDFIEACPDSKQARMQATSARQAAAEAAAKRPKVTTPRRKHRTKEPAHA